MRQLHFIFKIRHRTQATNQHRSVLITGEVRHQITKPDHFHMFVDNAAMKMLQDPCFFDVMVTENTFGDILTDEGSVISGSMAL